MNRPQPPEPSNCHLWRAPLTHQLVRASLSDVKTYCDDSHLTRRLTRCSCGQLYFYEWYEIIDWGEGNDPQYVTCIPVTDETMADELNTLSQVALIGLLAIHGEYPNGPNDPKEPFWANRKAP
jgi:hypothetical protein